MWMTRGCDWLQDTWAARSDIVRCAIEYSPAWLWCGMICLYYCTFIHMLAPPPIWYITSYRIWRHTGDYLASYRLLYDVIGLLHVVMTSNKLLPDTSWCHPVITWHVMTSSGITWPRDVIWPSFIVYFYVTCFISVIVREGTFWLFVFWDIASLSSISCSINTIILVMGCWHGIGCIRMDWRQIHQYCTMYTDWYDYI